MKVSTQRLTMSPITEDDWSLFASLHTNPQVIQLCFDTPDETALKSKFESRLARWDANSTTWSCMTIIEKLSGQKMVVTGLHLEDGIAEVGYLLLPEFHGKSYGTESLAGLMEWAYLEYGITHYKAVVTEGNIASERVLGKCGFHLDMVIPEAHMIGGKTYADHIYFRKIEA
ncbi:GNAT family N-acetyltransferase [Microbulbifer variabilis]|uniref:GNAT family N-acetyltransferase n=1 Tax=Microbulbifer variabilis TaxID=266805 RepID=UPI001CFCBA41|nr:GNAT family N-acetyltransferase [Microbulbifer variabilis]